MTPMPNRSTPLHRVIRMDAAACGGMGVLFVLGAGTLGSWLGLPARLLWGLGVFLIPFAGVLLWLAPRASSMRGAVRTIAAGNVLWVVASVLLLVSGRVDPTPLGTLFVVAQAVIVLAFAYVEHRGATRETRATATAGSAAAGR